MVREFLTFILESSIHFLLYLNPVVQGHLGGTGTRGARGFDQQANPILEFRPARSGTGRLIASTALVFLN